MEFFIADSLNWSTALSTENDITRWIRGIVLVLMSVSIMASIIIGSLAFKGLAHDGEWARFWPKIIGAMGMFIVPIAVYYLVTYRG